IIIIKYGIISSLLVIYFYKDDFITQIHNDTLLFGYKVMITISMKCRSIILLKEDKFKEIDKAENLSIICQNCSENLDLRNNKGQEIHNERSPI
ncbi:recQ-mediated genome instability protein 1-like isoform X2, partial [Vespula squamosa]